MEPTPKIPDEIQAILNKPVPTRSAEETAQLHKHFEQGVKTLAKFEVAEGGVYAVALSPNGDRVAAAGGDGTVRLIDTQRRRRWSPRSCPSKSTRTRRRPSSRVSPRRGSESSQDARPRDSEPPLPAGDAVVKLDVEPAAIQLDGPARYAQVVVMAEFASGAKVDVTGRAKFKFSEPVAKANSVGLVTPRRQRPRHAHRCRSATRPPTSTCKSPISTIRMRPISFATSPRSSPAPAATPALATVRKPARTASSFRSAATTQCSTSAH